jgi:hypothetical protein
MVGRRYEEIKCGNGAARAASSLEPGEAQFNGAAGESELARFAQSLFISGLAVT